MTAQTPVKAFNAYAAYLEEREQNARLYDMLLRATILLGIQVNKGGDVSHIEDFIKRAKEAM